MVKLNFFIYLFIYVCNDLLVTSKLGIRWPVHWNTDTLSACFLAV